MGIVDIRADPLAPYEEIHEAEGDGIFKITPPPLSSRLFLNAPGDMLDGWNKKKVVDSHTVWSQRNQGYDTGVPGTLRILNDEADGISIMNVDGSKKGLTLLPSIKSVDVDAFTMTEEFTIVNEGVGTDVVVIDDCSSVDGWSSSFGTNITISVVDGRLRVSGVSESNGKIGVKLVKPFDFSGLDFLTMNVECESPCNIWIYARTPTAQIAFLSAHDISNDKRICAMRARVTGTTSALPKYVDADIDISNIVDFYVFVQAEAFTTYTFYIDNITACNGTWAEVEVAVPDELQSIHDDNLVKVGAQFHNGTIYSGYAMTWDYNAMVGGGVANAIFGPSVPLLDGTKFNDVYGLNVSDGPYGKGGSVYPPSSRLTASSYPPGTGWRDPNAPSMVYSSAYGTAKRIGFALLIPPSDNDRTNINKVQLKLVTYYDDELGRTVPDLSGNGNDGVITGNVIKLVNGINFNNESLNAVKLFGTIPIAVSPERSVAIEITRTADVIGYPTIFDLSGSLVFPIQSGTNRPYIQFVTTVSRSIISSEELQLNVKSVLYGYVKEGDQKLWLNGVQVASGTYTGIVHSSMSPSTIGDVNDKNPFIIHRIATWTDCIDRSDDPFKYVNDASNYWSPTITAMGASTIEFAPDSFNHFLGLNHLGNWIAFERPDKRIEVYLFNRKPETLEFTEDENGNLTSIEVGLLKGTKVARAWVRYPDFDSDSNGDTIPNFIDKVDELSKKFCFIHEYRTEYALTSGVIINDFGIDPDEYPMAFPSVSKVYDEAGNLLPTLEIVSTETGDVKLVNVKGHDTIQVQTPPGNTAGDVVVYDVVGETKTVVTSVDHVFAGDCWVENGLIRVILSQSLRGSIYRYCDGKWDVAFGYSPYSIMANSECSIITLSSDEVAINAIGTLDSRSFYSIVSLRRGSRLVNMLHKSPDYGFTMYPFTRFMIRDGHLFDSDVLQEVTGDAPILSEECQVSFFDQDDTFAEVYATPRKEKVDSEYIPVGVNHVSAPIWYDYEPFSIGALPIAPVYIEAEDMGRSVATAISDPAMHPFTGVTGLSMPGLNSIANSFVNDGFESGDYTLYARVKSDNAALSEFNIYVVDDATNTPFTDGYNQKFAVSSTNFETISISFTVQEMYENRKTKLVFANRDTGENVSYLFDYTLIVPTGAIKTAAERSLASITINSKLLKEV